MFFAYGSKNHGIFSVFGQHRKTTGICAVFGMLQEGIFSCKSHKTHANHNIWGLSLGFVTWWSLPFTS
jgi:hypothetical protein